MTLQECGGKLLLITLDTGEVLDPEIALSLKEAANIGNSNFTEFVVSKIEKATKPLSDVIQKSNRFTFTNRPPTDLKKGKDKLGSSRANTALITKCLCRYKHVPMQMQIIFSNTKISTNLHHCRIEESYGLEKRRISWVVFRGCLVRDELQQLERLL